MSLRQISYLFWFRSCHTYLPNKATFIAEHFCLIYFGRYAVLRLSVLDMSDWKFELRREAPFNSSLNPDAQQRTCRFAAYAARWLVRR
jgi:hypothetical protein